MTRVPLPSRAWVAAVAHLALGCTSPSPGADTATGEAPRATPDTAPVAAPAATSDAWYHRARTLDLTGDGRADSVRLAARGTRPDSLEVTLTLVVDGEERHHERWGSSYELALVDSAARVGAGAAERLRAGLDSVLASVVVERLDAPGVRLMAEDSAILAGIVPPPTRRVSFSYGYESTTRLVWDAARERFVRLWSCC